MTDMNALVGSAAPEAASGASGVAPAPQMQTFPLPGIQQSQYQYQYAPPPPEATAAEEGDSTIPAEDEGGVAEGEAEDVVMSEAEGEEEESGTTVLQVSKIKKIFKMDNEHVSASSAAVFATAIATELFVQYFTEQASLIARSEKRKKLQYKDFASAVSNIEQLQFLSDVVPKTVSLKQLVEEKKVEVSRGKAEKELQKGQQTLKFGSAPGTGSAPAVATAGDAGEHEETEELPESDPEEEQEVPERDEATLVK